MPNDDNKAIDRTVFEVWSNGDLDRLDDLIAPQVVHHDPHDPHAAQGLDGLKKGITAYRRAFPDAHFTVEDQLAEADKVLTRWRTVGTHLGSLTDEPPTGRRVTYTGMVIERLEDGRIVEAWRNWDTLALLTAINAITPNRPTRNRA